MIDELLKGKKVGSLAVIAMVGSISGGIWGGALLWNQIQDNSAKIKSVKGYDDAWIRKLSDDNVNRVVALETKQSQVNFTEIMQKLERLEVQVANLKERQKETITKVESAGNPLSL
jgi:hypothetical protein